MCGYERAQGGRPAGLHDLVQATAILASTGSTSYPCPTAATHLTRSSTWQTHSSALTPTWSSSATPIFISGHLASSRATLGSLMNSNVSVLGTVNRDWAELVLTQYTGMARDTRSKV